MFLQCDLIITYFTVQYISQCAGSGTVRAFDCNMDELECKIAGSGDIEASVVNKIKAEIAGSGSVKYKGDPQDIQKKVMGSGKIEKVE